MLETHRNLLLDRARTESVGGAVFSAVRPGDVVVDVGTGTGILALIACRAGARRVVGVEVDPVLAEAAVRVARANGYEGRIEIVNAHSSELRLDEPADVLVAEIVGCLGFDEGFLTALPDARDRLLRPGGRIVPSAVAVQAVPAEAPQTYPRNVLVWRNGLHDFDLSAVGSAAVAEPHLLGAEEAKPLATPGRLLHVDSATVRPAPVAGEATFRVEEDGVCHGLAAWLSLELGGGRTLVTGPRSPCWTWVPGLFPLAAPVPVSPGCTVDAALEAIPWGGSVQWIWSLEVRDPGGSLLGEHRATTALPDASVPPPEAP